MTEGEKKGFRYLWEKQKELSKISEEQGRKFSNYRLRLDDSSEIKLEDRHYFTLLLLLKEGELDRSEIKGRVLQMATQFSKATYIMEDGGGRRNRHNSMDIDLGLLELERSGMVLSGDKDSFLLTENGKELAGEIKGHIEEGAKHVKAVTGFFLDPLNVAKVTIIIDVFLAFIKVFAGLITGSVALLADGGDATIDAISAFVVWISMKLKREMIGTTTIVLMMFFTGITIGWESISSLIEAFRGSLDPIYLPGVVIVVEVIAMLAALLLYLYQGFAGKRSGSLSLISQSIDSRNHIFVAGAVIAGSVFSIFGIHFVDAAISAGIVIRIMWDAIGLARELVARAKGDRGEVEGRKMLFEKGLTLHKNWVFRDWILYTLHCKGPLSRSEIVDELETTFKPKYLPIVSEFDLGIGKNFDFYEGLDDLIKPLEGKGYITHSDGSYRLTDLGDSNFGSRFRNMRYHWS